MPKKKPFTNWDDVPLYLDLPYLSLLFGLSIESLKKKAQAGTLPAAKMGNKWLISKEDAISYFESLKTRKES